MRGAKFPKFRHVSYIVVLLLVFVSARVLSRNQSASAAACSASNIAVTRVSSPVFYVDSGITPAMDSGYVAYRVQTGASTSFSDLWVKAGSFSDPTKLTLAPNEDGNYRIGATAVNSTKHSYFYLKGTVAKPNTPEPAQNYVLTFYEGNPASGGVINCTVAVSNSGVEEIIKASPNKINSVVTTTPYLGGQITMTVNGDTGTMGASNLFTYTPASSSGWQADCFVLKAASLTYTGGNTGSQQNSLFLNFASGVTTNYTVVYTFDVRCDLPTVTPITPKSDINSGGSNVKHTDTGTATYQAIAAISPTQKSVVVGKSVSPTSVSMGASTPSYTISLTNTGPNEVIIDSIRDTLPSSPASVSYNAGTSIFNGVAYANPTVVGQTLTWTGPFTIPAGTTRNMLYTVSVPSTIGTYINSAVAFIGSLQIDTTNSTSDNSPASTKYYVGIPNFSTSTKTVEDLNGGTTKPGETLRYTITVKNTGTGSGTLVNIIDNIDSDTQNLANVTTTNCGSTTNNSSASQLNISNATITTLNNCVITFDVTVKTPLNEGTEIANTASISGGEQNGTGSSPSSTPLYVDATPNLTASKTADVITPIVVHEQVIDYLISITNSGDGAASGVSFTDVIDSDVTYNPATITYTNCGSPSQSFANPTLTVSNITINAGATCQVHIYVTVKLSALHNNLVINGVDVSAAVEGGNNPAITNAVDLTIDAAPNLSTSTKSVEDVNGGVVEPGDILRYTIWIINTDTGPGSAIPLTDIVDTDTELVTSDPENVGAVTFDNCGSPLNSSTPSELNITNITASVDVDCRVTFDVNVKAGVSEGTEIANTAHIGQAFEGGPGADPSSPSLFVDTTPVISLAKTDDDDDDVVDLLQEVTYTLTLSNTGNGPGTVNVTDTVTGSTSAITNLQLTNCGSLFTPIYNGQQITINNVVVGIVNDCVITYKIAVLANALGLSKINNTADASIPSQGGADPSPSSASELTVHEDPLLAVTKTDDDTDNVVAPSQTITYTIAIINSGNASTTTSLTDTLSSGFGTPYSYSYTNCGSPTKGYAPPTTTLTAIDIAVGTTCTITYKVDVISPLNEGTKLKNTVDVARADPTKGNDPDPVTSDTLTLDATPNLSASTKSVLDVNGGTVQPNDTLRYTITIKNTGNGQATGVDLTDALDSDVNNPSNVSITNCGPGYNSSTASTIQVFDSTVGVGTDCVIIYEVKVKLGAVEGAEISNTADISPSTEGGPGATPSSTKLYVDITPTISITKTENDTDNVVDPGQVIRYTVTLINSGDGSGTTNLTDTISGPILGVSNFALASCGSGSTNSSSGMNIQINNLVVAVGTNCVVTYDVTVTSGALGGEVINNTADASTALEGGANPSPNSADTLTVNDIPVLQVNKTEDDADNVVEPGQTINYTISIRNLGNATGNTSLTDQISIALNAPFGINYSGCGTPNSSFTSSVLSINNIRITTADDCVITYSVTVKSPLDASVVINNNVDVASADEGSNDPSPVSASTLSLKITPDFSTSTKTVEDLNGGSLAPGDAVQYTINIINSGNGTATGVSLKDTVDLSYELLREVTLVSCGASSTDNSTTTKLDISGLIIEVGTNCAVTFKVTVKATVPDGTVISNSAFISSANEGGSSKIVSSPNITVDIIPNLVVTAIEDDADDKVTRNQEVNYTITIVNNGNGVASGVSFTSLVSGPTGSITGITATGCGASANVTASGQALSGSTLTIQLGTQCVVKFKVIVNETAKFDEQVKMSVDVSQSSQGGNNPDSVSSNTLVVQAPEIVPTISLESVEQISFTEFRVKYLAKLESVGTLPVNNLQIRLSLKPLINSGEEVTVIGTELVDPFANVIALINSGFNGDSDEFLIANNPNTGVQLDAKGGNDSGVIRVTLRLVVPFGEDIPDLNFLGTSESLSANSNLVNVLLPDADKDGFIDTTESNTADRDGDGIVDSDDFDPQGFFYCTDNGRIIPGGKITVKGPGKITVIADGSGGFYQWFASGTPGLYEMELTAPNGTVVATELINTGVLDPTGKDNPYSLGSNQYQQSGKLADFTSAANPVYLKFDIASGDPWIINNNIPLKNCGALALTSMQNQATTFFKSNPRITLAIGAGLLAVLIALEIVWRRHAMEKPIKPGKRFIVAAGNPKRIIARKYGIDNYIERLSDKRLNNRTTTSSIHYAGWLKKTVKPGDKGLSVIGGHVYGKRKEGAFVRLNELQKDDIFEVEFGNGAVRKFIVESVRLVKAHDISRESYRHDKNIEKQVNLVTFASKYDGKTHYPADRVLVIGRYDEEKSS